MMLRHVVGRWFRTLAYFNDHSLYSVLIFFNKDFSFGILLYILNYISCDTMIRMEYDYLVKRYFDIKTAKEKFFMMIKNFFLQLHFGHHKEGNFFLFWQIGYSKIWRFERDFLEMNNAIKMLFEFSSYMNYSTHNSNIDDLGTNNQIYVCSYKEGWQDDYMRDDYIKKNSGKWN